MLAGCAKKAAVDLPRARTCLVRLASDVQSPGLGQTFFLNVLKPKLCACRRL